MRTSSIGQFVILFLLCLALLVPQTATAQGSILDLVRQTAQGNVPNPGNYSQFVPANASAFGAGPGAANWVRDVTGAASGWSYTAANGWQFAAATDQIVSQGHVAQGTQYSGQAQSNFAPGWQALTGVAFWSQIGQYAPLWGMFIYTPTWTRYQYRTGGVN
jgi:hypothetical protein